MSDVLSKSEVFLEQWAVFEKEIREHDYLAPNMFTSSLLEEYKDQAILILEECFGEAARSDIELIKKVNELKPQGTIGDLNRKYLNYSLYQIRESRSLKYRNEKARVEIRSKIAEKNKKPSNKKPSSRRTIISNKIFLVHGHDNEMKQHVARIITKLGLEPIILHEQVDKGRTIIRKFEDETSDVGFAVILLSPDDFGGIHNSEESKPRARQNVVFEHGYFFGKLGRERTVSILRKKKGFEIPSDLLGVLYKEYKPSSNDWAYELCAELKAAGYDVTKDSIK